MVLSRFWLVIFISSIFFIVFGLFSSQYYSIDYVLNGKQGEPLLIGEKYLSEVPQFVQDSLQKAANTAKVNAMVAEGYSKFPIEFKNQSAEFLEILSNEENYPILFHCTAGTDRTGYLAALTLSILGVDRAVIEDDYALSAKLRLNQEEKDTRIVTTLDKINELGGIGKYVESLPKNVDTDKIKSNLLHK